MMFSSWLRSWKRSLERRWALRPALRRKPAARRPRLEVLEDRWLLSAFVVTNTNDSGSGSLRAAIAAVNAGTDNEIDFAISGSGVQTINLTSALPALKASSVYLNGLSQGGSGNTTPLIEINGSSAGAGADGLIVKGSNCTVSGLIIEGFGPSGTLGGNGIEVEGVNNVIGGTAAGAGNVLSGNGADGLRLDSSGNVVQGNFVGTDPSGTVNLYNYNDGIEIAHDNNTIGGSVGGACNYIADNTAGGILVSSGSSDTLRRNLIYAKGLTQSGPGIGVYSGANNNVAAPVITSATYSSTTQTLTVKGTYTAPTAGVSYVLEFFANATGDAEGQVYLGRLVATPKTTGTKSFTFNVTTSVVGSDPLITVTLTDASGDTSPFSVGVIS